MAGVTLPVTCPQLHSVTLNYSLDLLEFGWLRTSVHRALQVRVQQPVATFTRHPFQLHSVSWGHYTNKLLRYKVLSS